MAKLFKTKVSETDADTQLYTDLKQHYDWASNETDKRRTGRGRMGSISFDEADELFRSWIDESKWPYDALLFDPRTFTFIIEKTSRLLSNKLKGKLIPREGSDVLSAHINNTLLDFQWDRANRGGTMLSKWALMDINTRKYGAAFALCKWRYEKSNNKVVFCGPEMRVLNNRDCMPDPASTSIESCNWFQAREYVTIQELEKVNDATSSGEPIYKNLARLKESIGSKTLGGGDSRDVNWISRNRTISGLSEDPIGKDRVFKTVELVTEYRRDRWIVFSPKHGIVLRDIPNPYDNNELPIVMLRYYQVDDDMYGMSEIEPVKGPQKAINALLSQYVDEINQHLYTPIAIGPGVREHTLQWGKGARWRMNNPMTDFRLVESRSGAAQYFNNTYSALVAAMMNAVGESSLGISNTNRYQPEKTAAEVKAVSQQRNARDTFNQNFLAEALERQMMLWHSMNQKMLFADDSKKHYIVRVVGKEALDYFNTYGLGINNEIDEKAAHEIALNPEADLVTPRNEIPEDVLTPKYPVNIGTEDKPKMVPKFNMDSAGQSGEVYVEPEDIMGSFDFIADVQSMSLGGLDDLQQGRKAAVTTLLSSPVASQLLAQEQVKPKFRELFVAWLEDSGFKNADQYFEKIMTPPQGQPTGPGGMGMSPDQGGTPPGQPPIQQTSGADLMANLMKQSQQGGGGLPTNAGQPTS